MASTQAYANPFAVKLPLLRVAHPSQAENAASLDQAKTTLAQKR